MKTREMMKTGAIGIALLLSTGAAGLDEEFSPALTHSLLGSIENPAALVEEKKLTVGAQLAVESPDLRSLGQGSGGGALPADNYDYGNAGALRSTSFRAHVPVPYGIHLGVSGSLPGDFLRLHVPSGGERSYLRYTERNQKPEVSTGLGLALPLGFSVGGGIYHSVEAKGKVQIAAAGDGIHGRALVDASPVQIPYYGLRWQGRWGRHRLALDGSYRGASDTEASFDAEVIADVDVGTLPLDASAGLALFYEPAVRRLGLAYQLASWGLWLGYEEEEWSAYKAPFFSLVNTLTEVAEQEAVVLQDSRTLRVAAGHRLDLTPTAAGSVILGFSRRSSALPGTPGSLAIIDVPEEVYTLATRLVLKKTAADPEPGAGILLSLQDRVLLDRTLNQAGIDTVRAGGRIRTWTAGVDFTL